MKNGFWWTGVIRFYLKRLVDESESHIKLNTNESHFGHSKKAVLWCCGGGWAPTSPMAIYFFFRSCRFFTLFFQCSYQNCQRSNSLFVSFIHSGLSSFEHGIQNRKCSHWWWLDRVKIVFFIRRQKPEAVWTFVHELKENSIFSFVEQEEEVKLRIANSDHSGKNRFC